MQSIPASSSAIMAVTVAVEEQEPAGFEIADTVE